MVDDVDLVDELVDDRRVQNRIDDEVEVAPARKVRHVVDRARREVVEYPHLPTVLEEELAEVRADEAGAAGDEGLRWHGESLQAAATESCRRRRPFGGQKIRRFASSSAP